MPTLVREHKVIKHKGTRQFQALVQFSDGESSWVDASALRISHPYVMISYVMKNNLDKHPDFKWVKEYKKDTRKMDDRRTAFKAKVNPSTLKFKFGIEVPRSVRHALMLDKANHNKLWKEAIEKELKQITITKPLETCRKGRNLETLQGYHITLSLMSSLI